MYIHLNESKQIADVTLLLLYSNTWYHLTVHKKEWIRARLKRYVQYVHRNSIFYIYVKTDVSIK